MNRGEFQDLADVRIDEAQALLRMAPARPDGAYYLAGYAVECALKAVIARLNNQDDWPEKQFVNDCHTHDLPKLFRLAGLVTALNDDIVANPTLGQNWDVVKDWSERGRYERHSLDKSNKMVDAVNDVTNGVAPMDQGPLVAEQIDAGAKLIEAFDKYAPVQAALWVKESDDGEWYLFLASDRIDDSNFDLGYGEIIRLLGKGPHLWLHPFQVKVMGTNTRVAQAVLDLLRKHPSQMPTRYQGPPLGGLYIKDAYIYSMPIPSGT